MVGTRPDSLFNVFPNVHRSNECKRRKIKCNGETPCKRCGNLNLACLYAPNCCSNNFKDTDDYRHITSNLARLQDEVNWLNQTVKALQADPARLAPAHIDHGGIPAMSPSPSVPSSAPSRPRPDPTYPKTGSFQGPTTMAYSLDVANNTISNMGYRPLGEGTSQHPHQQQPSGPLSATTPGPMSGGNTRSNQPDPLFEFERDEMLRLCQLYEDEVGAMYPVINIQTVMSHARSLASFMGPLRSQPPLEMLNDDKTLLLKTAMCCALVVDEHGHSDRAVRLFDSMEAVLNRKLIAEVSNVESLVVLAMMAGYRYLSNDEVLGWRVIGQVARLCFELGIHRHQGLMRIKNERDRKDALNSFWTAFVLDRRWAFQTGLPFVIQDGEIDPKLPMPVSTFSLLSLRPLWLADR